MSASDTRTLIPMEFPGLDEPESITTPEDPEKSAHGQTRQQQSASCTGCTERWTGTAACHCVSCHRTFTGISAFDKHRRAGNCLDPSAVGLVLNERSRWGGEPMPEGVFAETNR